jgi:hypothetical protein
MARVTAPPDTSAQDVADYFLTLAATTEDEPDYLSPMRLQKLLYLLSELPFLSDARGLFLPTRLVSRRVPCLTMTAAQSAPFDQA